MYNASHYTLSIIGFNGSDEKMKDVYTLRGIIKSHYFEDECENTLTGISVTFRHDHIIDFDYVVQKCKRYGLQVEIK